METALIVVAIITLAAVFNARRHMAGIRRDVARLDRKLSLVLTSLNVAYDDPLALSEQIKDIARDPSRKLDAIKAYREQTGAGLAEAKQAVETFIDSLKR